MAESLPLVQPSMNEELFQAKHDLAAKHAQRGDFTRAFRLYFELYQMNQGHIGVVNGLALCLDKQGKTEDAILLLRDLGDAVNNIEPLWRLLDRLVSENQKTLDLGPRDGKGETRAKVPNMLFLEVSDVCNANCIFCSYQFDPRKKGFLKASSYEKALREYHTLGGKSVSLSPMTGEIFMNNDILSILELIDELGFEDVYSYTNLLRIHKFDMDTILHTGFTQLRISAAPLEVDVYTKMYGVSAQKYEQLLKNFKSFLSALKEADNPKLQSVVIEFRSDRDLRECLQTSDFKEWVQPYLSERVTLAGLRDFDSWMGQIEQENLLPGMRMKSAEFNKPIPCARLYNVHVRASGDIRICGCRIDYRKEDVFKVGHIENDNILDVYNSDKSEALLEAFRNGNPPEECKSCSWYGA